MAAPIQTINPFGVVPPTFGPIANTITLQPTVFPAPQVRVGSRVILRNQPPAAQNIGIVQAANGDGTFTVRFPPIYGEHQLRIPESLLRLIPDDWPRVPGKLTTDMTIPAYDVLPVGETFKTPYSIANPVMGWKFSQ